MTANGGVAGRGVIGVLLASAIAINAAAAAAAAFRFFSAIKTATLVFLIVKKNWYRERYRQRQIRTICI